MSEERGFTGPDAAAQREEFVQLMLTVAEVTKERLSEVSLEVYEMVLFPKYSLGDVRRVLMEMLDEAKFVPKPAEIAERIGGSKSNQANEAWRKVEQAIGEIGQYRSVVFDDPAIHAAIHSMGGWISICQRMNEFTAREFAAEFKSRYTMTLAHYPPVLVGVRDLPKLTAGQEVIPEVMGDLEKAKRIWLGGDVKMLPRGTRA